MTLTVARGTLPAPASEEPLAGVTISQLPPERVVGLADQLSIPTPLLMTPKLCEGGAAPLSAIARNSRPRCERRSFCCPELTVSVTGISMVWLVVELVIVIRPGKVPSDNPLGSAVTAKEWPS